MKKSDKECFLEVYVQYLEKLHGLHNDLPFLPERMKTANLHDKTEYVIHVRNLKQALNNLLVWQKVPRVIKFNQNSLLKPCIDINTDLRKKAKSDFEIDFFKLMNNAVYGKTMENVRKHKVIKLVTAERRRKYFVSEPKYHTTHF